MIIEDLCYDDYLYIIDTKLNRVYYESMDGHWEKRGYNERSQRVSSLDSYGHWSRSEYDDYGNRTYWHSSNGYWWRKEFSDLGEELSFIDSTGTRNIYNSYE